MAFDSKKLEDGFKKLLMAGIGAVATAAEKSGEIIEGLAKKGEATWEQNKDLQQNVRSVVEKTGSEAEVLAQKIAKLSKEEIDKLSVRVEDLRKKAEEKLNNATDAIDEEVDHFFDEEEEKPEEAAPAEEAPAPAEEAPKAEAPAAEAPEEEKAEA